LSGSVCSNGGEGLTISSRVLRRFWRLGRVGTPNTPARRIFSSRARFFRFMGAPSSVSKRTFFRPLRADFFGPLPRAFPVV
jgi:hypothetical protein